VKVELLLFAQIREAFGVNQMTVEAEATQTVGGLAKSLFKEKGFSQLESLPLLYGVNENYVKSDAVLKEGDVVSLMPPVAGG